MKAWKGLAYTYLKLHYQLFFLMNREVCLIYQMGKVASSSIKKTLKYNTCYNTFHVHRLNPENIKVVEKEHKKKGIHKPKENVKGKMIYNHIIQKDMPCKIVSLVREPIGRNISAYFQNIDTVNKRDNAYKKMKLGQLVDQFMQSYNHNVPLEWFDEEMLTTTGIDVYDREFDKEEGYQVIHNEKYEVLVMRYDLDNERKAQVLSTFLEAEIDQICSTNMGDYKGYRDVYRTFKESIRLPKSYAEKMLNSKYCKHFFPQHEVDMLYSKYTC